MTTNTLKEVKASTSIVDRETSFRILKKAHHNHASHCCPDPADYDVAVKLSAFDKIIGVYPVHVGDKRQTLYKALDDYADYSIDRKVRMALRKLKDISKEDYTNNVIPKDMFTAIQTAIKEQDTYEYKEFQLIKRSSPKVSNIIASLLKFAGQDHENHQLMKDFNNRGESTMKDYELIMSTEVHRIVGMSAFGKYTSCQDWIRKDDSHEYHNYTHQSWANQLDETVGVLYIRDKKIDAPSEEATHVHDMCARSLVRLLELDNGQVVVFLHRIYAKSPFDTYMKDTIDEWVETLPANYHVVRLYDGETAYKISGTNKHGKIIEGSSRILHKQQYCSVNGCSREQCSECEGEGRVRCYECSGRGEFEDVECDCDECDGSGTIEEDCPECDGVDCRVDEDGEEYTCGECDGTGKIENDCDECNGSGTVYRDVECDNCGGEGYFECNYCDGGYCDDEVAKCEPYNDHTDWITFRVKGVEFYVPDYIIRWDEAYTQEELDAIEADRIYWETAPHDLKVGDKVRVRPDLSGGVRYRMKGESRGLGIGEAQKAHAGKIVTIHEVTQMGYKLDVMYSTWTDEMFEYVTEEEIANFEYENMLVEAYKENEHRNRLASLNVTPQNEYAVGDHVMILETLSTRYSNTHYVGVNEDMANKKGKIVRIESKRYSESHQCYLYSTDEDPWIWIAEMFEGVVMNTQQLREVI